MKGIGGNERCYHWGNVHRNNVLHWCVGAAMKCDGCVRVADLRREIDDLLLKVEFLVKELASNRAALAMSEMAKNVAISEWCGCVSCSARRAS